MAGICVFFSTYSEGLANTPLLRMPTVSEIDEVIERARDAAVLGTENTYASVPPAEGEEEAFAWRLIK